MTVLWMTVSCMTVSCMIKSADGALRWRELFVLAAGCALVVAVPEPSAPPGGHGDGEPRQEGAGQEERANAKASQDNAEGQQWHAHPPLDQPVFHAAAAMHVGAGGDSGE
jgi:hypothetical protein